MSDLNLRFLPWLRRGLGRSIAASADSSATVAFRLNVGGERVEQALRMRGPGDVVGLDPAQIIRVEPRPGTADFEPNYFPAIEFATPDLPWMFTPTAPGADHHLLPWLALVTVQDELATIETRAGVPLPVLTVPPSELPPDPGELWAWAHVQSSEIYDREKLTQALNDTPEAFISRILSPRNLRPDTGYLACLVPTYEAGRLAGLGLPVAAEIGQAFAWEASSSAPAELPVYHWWSFHTSLAGDFQTLVSRLEPRELDETVGRRELDIGNLADLGILRPADLPETTFFFGALVSSTAMSQAAPGREPPDRPPSPVEPFPIEHPPHPLPRTDPVRSALYQFLTSEVAQPQGGPYDYRVDDPAVTPPIYGREQLDGEPLPSPGVQVPESLLGEEPIWYSVVNTLPRARGAAGLGMRVVRQHQEDFMARAWSEVTSLRAINQTLQQATYASLVANRWQARVAALDDGDALQLTRAAHTRILPASGKTIWGQVRAAEVPAGVISTGFQRMLRTGSVIHHAMRLTTGSPRIQGEIRRITVADPSRLMALSVHSLPVGAQLHDTASQESSVLTPQTYTGPLSGTIIHIDNRLDTVLEGGVETAERPEITGAVLSANQLASRHVAYLDRLAERGQTLPPAMAASRDTASALVEATNRYVNLIARGTLPSENQIKAIRAQARRFNGSLNDWVETGGDIVIMQDGPIVTTTTTLEPIATALQRALNPNQTISNHLQSRISVSGSGWGARLIPSRLTVDPLFDDALYRYVCEIDPEYMLPGIGTIPQNTVGLLEVNGEFVEAVLIGSNHEMSREMRWREYPANLSSTWFRRFWSATADDIGPIGGPDWPGDHTLGDNITGPMKDATLVLLIKGEILKRYPNMAVYALPATVTELPDDYGRLRRVRVPAEPEVPQYPVFAGKLDNGVKFFGFEGLKFPDVLGTATPANDSTDGGTFFALEEQPTEPRFGLNEYEPGTTYDPARVGNWSELSWGHFVPGDDLDLPAYLPISGAFDGVSLPDTAETDARDTTWGRHAAAMARIVLQRPVRVLVHASAMLPLGTRQ